MKGNPKMLNRPMTNEELREALAIAENNIKSLKGDVARHRGKIQSHQERMSQTPKPTQQLQSRT